MRWFVGLALLMGLGLAGYVRLAPDDPARWHVAVPEAPVRGAVLFLPGDGRALLEALVARVAGEARVTLLAGAVEAGRITWVARSAVWGFPDYITAEVGPDGLRLWSRQRYGTGDYGVNAARLRRWTEGL